MSLYFITINIKLHNKYFKLFLQPCLYSSIILERWADSIYRSITE